MKYAIARTFQVIGLILLPIAILGELDHRLTLAQSLGLSTFGVLAFLFGHFLNGTVQS